MGKKKLNKHIKRLIITGSVILGISGILMGTVAIVGPTVDSAGYRYIIGGWLTSYLKPTPKSVKKLKEKTGGIIHGVCHPKNDYDNLQEAGVDWVRFDLTCPALDRNNEPTAGYLSFKADAKTYADRGINVMVVTPYPCEYVYYTEYGGDESNGIVSTVDPRTEAGLEYVKKEAKFIVQDLQGICNAVQITNEMTVDRFRTPLNLDEAAKYVSVQLEAMSEVKGNTIVGYNVADFSMYQFFTKVGDYNKYCDYLGVDLYLGCFEGTFHDLIWYDIILRGFFQQSGLPMLVNEFGYIGAGQTKTQEEKTAILQQFGFNSEEEAKANIRLLFEHPDFPSEIRRRINTDYPGASDSEIADLIFNPDNVNGYRQHFYEEISEGFQLTDYPHTPEGQASFYRDVIQDHFMKMPFLCGSFAYCWKEPQECYICGSPNCPIETGWGFVKGDGSHKPSFDALKESYSLWK